MPDSHANMFAQPKIVADNKKDRLAQNLGRAFQIGSGGSFTDLLDQLDQIHRKR